MEAIERFRAIDEMAYVNFNPTDSKIQSMWLSGTSWIKVSSLSQPFPFYPYRAPMQELTHLFDRQLYGAFMQRATCLITVALKYTT